MMPASRSVHRLRYIAHTDCVSEHLRSSSARNGYGANCRECGLYCLATTFSKSTYLGLDPYEDPTRQVSFIITTSNELNSFVNCSGCFQGPNDELARSRQIRWSCGMISMVETGDRAEQGRRQGLSASSETHARMGLGYAILSWIMSAGLLSPETDAINMSRVRTCRSLLLPL